MPTISDVMEGEDDGVPSIPLGVALVLNAARPDIKIGEDETTSVVRERIGSLDLLELADRAEINLEDPTHFDPDSPRNRDVSESVRAAIGKIREQFE